MDVNIPFKSYCWSLGTTSFRTKDFNIKIEKQLQLLDTFWKKPEFSNKIWRDVQGDYYTFMQENGFVTGDANRPDKDAREKTSGLVDIGLLNSERRLTEVGNSLLEISKDGDFSSDNPLELDKDSFIYLKQLLKTSNLVEGKVVRPFIVLAYALSQLEFLSYEEFTYLLPLCTTEESLMIMIDNIREKRSGNITLDDTILNTVLSMDNYQSSHSYFMKEKVTEETIRVAGMNRKSRNGGANYDKHYYPVYQNLCKVFLNQDESAVFPLFEAVQKIKNSPKTMWKQLLFGNAMTSVIRKGGLDTVCKAPFQDISSEDELKEVFFFYLHLFKIRTTLHDYFDLNRRYFRTTDTLLFQEEKIEFDVLPKVYFHQCAKELLSIGFVSESKKEEDLSLDKIAPCLKIDISALYNALGIAVGETVNSVSDAQRVVRDQRYQRLEQLIEQKFSKEQLIHLMTLFENRTDRDIRQLVTDNAEIPTIFEYVLGIAWYIISGKQGNVLDYVKLSLDADLLPKSHAAGGAADIVYEYKQSSDYPDHTLLIEATLSSDANQRRMEMEPVTRHLGNYLLSNQDTQAYCVFISTYLDRNVISDFRQRKSMEYFDTRSDARLEGMKIIPMDTSLLKSVLEKGHTYEYLYEVFENAYESDMKVSEGWFEETIKRTL